MKLSHIGKPLALLAVGAAVGAVALMTRSAGRDQCPQCGYLHDLHSCKHCGWTACLGCWQRMSRNDTCPSCGRADP